MGDAGMWRSDFVLNSHEVSEQAHAGEYPARGLPEIGGLLELVEIRVDLTLVFEARHGVEDERTLVEVRMKKFLVHSQVEDELTSNLVVERFLVWSEAFSLDASHVDDVAFGESLTERVGCEDGFNRWCLGVSQLVR